ncbi:MAG: M10 family metallopeptidase C-terminal domain-containing protein [Elsteraceae bacterium]
MGNGINGNRLGVFRIARSSDPYVDALMGTYAWAVDASRTITYSYPNPVTSYLGLGGGVQVPFNSNLANTTFSTLRPAVSQMLQAYSNVANINFTQVADDVNGAGDIRFIVSIQSPTAVGAFTVLPAPTEVTGGLAGDEFLYRNVLFDNTPGSYGYLTVLHELGHALGLKHPGNYNAIGNAAPPFFPAREQDTTALSVMSYHQDVRINGYVSTPGIADIRALQYIYGANMKAAPGDDTYQLSLTRMQTVWDPNGTNSLNGAGVSGDQRISLAEYSFSFSGGKITGALAAGTKMANAVGGAGNDTLIGNALNNRLTGGAGDDALIGGAGVDTAVFRGFKSAYTVTLSADRQSATVSSLPGFASEGIDTLTGIELLAFADRTVAIDRAAVTPIGVAIANQLSVVYLGRGVGAEYRDGIAAQVGQGPSVEMQKAFYNAALADGAYSNADITQAIVSKTFVNMFGVQATAFEQAAWTNIVNLGVISKEQLPWVMFVSYLGATNVPASYQIPAQSRIIAADAFTNQIGDAADAKLGVPGASAASVARSWLSPIRTQADAARKAASAGADLSAILTTNKFQERGLLEAFDPVAFSVVGPATAALDPLDMTALIGVA